MPRYRVHGLGRGPAGPYDGAGVAWGEHDTHQPYALFGVNGGLGEGEWWNPTSWLKSGTETLKPVVDQATGLLKNVDQLTGALDKLPLPPDVRAKVNGVIGKVDKSKVQAAKDLAAAGKEVPPELQQAVKDQLDITNSLVQTLNANSGTATPGGSSELSSALLAMVTANMTKMDQANKNMGQASTGTPGWVWAAVAVGGVAVLGLGAFLLMRKR